MRYDKDIDAAHSYFSLIYIEIAQIIPAYVQNAFSFQAILCQSTEEREREKEWKIDTVKEKANWTYVFIGLSLWVGNTRHILKIR